VKHGESGEYVCMHFSNTFLYHPISFAGVCTVPSLPPLESALVGVYTGSLPFVLGGCDLGIGKARDSSASISLEA